MDTDKWQSERDPTAADTRPSRNNKEQAHSNTQKTAEPPKCSAGPTYGTFLSSITQEDVERIRKEAERLRTDDKARKELFIRIGVYDKDGNIAEPFRHLFEASECTPRT